MLHKVDTVSIEGSEYTVVVTQGSSPKSPVTVYFNQENNSSMGDYVYTIGQASAQLNSTDHTASGVASLSQLLNRKYGRPVYVNVNGVMGNVVEFFRAVTALVPAP